MADGLRRHLPGGVAILVKGAPVCVLCAFIQFVLGVALSTTAIVALFGAAGIGGIPTLVRAVRPSGSESQTLDGSGNLPSGTPPRDLVTRSPRRTPR